MAEPYTPSLDEVRAWYVEFWPTEPGAGAEFDRMIEAVKAEERERTINEAQDELVRQDAFTERSLRILDGLRAQGRGRDNG